MNEQTYLYVRLMLPILPLGMSIFAVAMNYSTTKRAGSLKFGPIFLAAFAIPLVLAYQDLHQMFPVIPRLPISWGLETLYLACFVTAYPFYMTLAQRLRDIRMSKHLILLGLVPYINFLFCLVVLLVPSQIDRESAPDVTP